MEQDKPLLKVENLEVQFYSVEGTLRAVNGVTFNLRDGETLGIVGESGCGKSVTSQGIMRIIPGNGKIVDGNILLRQREDEANSEGDGYLDLTQLDPRGEEIRSIRGRDISMVFQEPMTSFSPVYTIGNQIIEVIRLHQKLDKQAARERAIELLRLVEMPKPEEHIDSFSFSLSGGMRQRAMIAMALACSPRILIADEPTSALDVTIQAQILDMIGNLQEKMHMSVIMITHDLGVIAQLTDNVLIMYLGDGMEYGPVDTIYHNPKHPYTVGLLKSVPVLGEQVKEDLVPIEGIVPSLYKKPKGCPFNTRCPQVMDICREAEPENVMIEENHYVKCHLYTSNQGE
jgi:peptide/nickel transport system ATP-binding protein